MFPYLCSMSNLHISTETEEISPQISKNRDIGQNAAIQASTWRTFPHNDARAAAYKLQALLCTHIVP
jgi:hypothetical protein